MQALLGAVSCPVGQVHLAAVCASCRKNVESDMHVSGVMTLQLKHKVCTNFDIALCMVRMLGTA